jgi:zinc transporter ZupT
MVVGLITSCATLAMVPASGMLMGSLSVYMISLNRVVLACLQCLGAGLILGAIGSELLPHLAAIHAGLEGTISITAGFFLGIVTMFYVKSIAHDQGDDDDHEMERKPLLLRSMSTLSPPTSPHRRKSSRFHDSWEVRSTSLGSINLRRPSRLERACCDMQAAAELTERTQPLPWGLIIAVAVDNLVDGFFLGIAYIAAPRAGQIMAVATAIEMTFLGLTYSASMLKSGMTPKTLFLIAMMPFLLVFGSVAGALLGDVASTSPQVYAGFLSFGVAALIFLVTQELLLEANENLEEDNVPYINSCLFIGFWAILIIERTIG